MQITVKLFAIFQETFACEEMVLDLPTDAVVTDVFAALVTQKPEFQKWQSVARYAVNLEFVDGTTLLKPGDVVALIPPVSGG